MPVSIGYSVPPRSGPRARVSGLVLAAISNSVQFVARSAVQWMERREALRALRSLDDHMLKDIGLHRSEILRAVYGESDQRPRRGK